MLRARAMLSGLVMALALLATDAAPAAGEGLPAIGIIMDDIGYRRTDGLRALELPGPIAYAVLPHTPYGSRLATIAFQLDKEVLLHVPMESRNGKALGPGGLTTTMSERELRAVLDAGLASIPHVRGVNNHMGSLRTQSPRAMTWIMRWMQENGGLFFVDSLTSSGSVALDSAREAGLPAIARDVFLDAEADSRFVRRQFQQLVELARDRGTALGIAHPYPETLAVLREVLLKPSYYGVELVSLEELITRRVSLAAAANPSLNRSARYAANAAIPVNR